MKKHSPGIFRQETEDYLEHLMPPRKPLYAEIEAAARRRGALASPELGKLLQCLSRGAKARSILQIGVGDGYETLWLASSSQPVEITVIDEESEAFDRVEDLLHRDGFAGVLKPREGELFRVLQTLEGEFDLVYLKAGSSHYRRCLDLILPRVRVGGLVVVNNLLLGGAISAPADFEGGVDEETLRAIRAFNGYFMVHPQLCSVILPVAQGIGLATKLKPLVTEMGGPF